MPNGTTAALGSDSGDHLVKIDFPLPPFCPFHFLMRAPLFTKESNDSLIRRCCGLFFFIISIGRLDERTEVERWQVGQMGGGGKNGRWVFASPRLGARRTDAVINANAADLSYKVRMYTYRYVYLYLYTAHYLSWFLVGNRRSRFKSPARPSPLGALANGRRGVNMPRDEWGISSYLEYALVKPHSLFYKRSRVLNTR